MKSTIENEETHDEVWCNYRKNKSMFWDEAYASLAENKEDKLRPALSTQNEVSTRKKNIFYNNTIRNILELITKHESLTTIARNIEKIVTAHIEDVAISIAVLNNDLQELQQLAGPVLPPALVNTIKDTACTPEKEGHRNEVFLTDEEALKQLRSGKRATADQWSQLEACWSFPVTSSAQEILGTVTVCFSKSRRLLPSEKSMIKDITQLASVAIEQHQNKKRLEEYAKTLEEKVEDRTQELMATVKKLEASNSDLENQIAIAEQAERKSVASKALTYAIAQNFPKGAIVVINKNLKCELVEGEVLSQIGVKHIFTGMSLEDITILSEDQKKRIKEDIAKTLSGKNLSFEIKFRNTYFSVNSMPLLGEDKQINSVLFVYSDVTEKKEIELNMKNALEKEKELNELKSRFISLASHEFRTPLSAIMTSAILIGKQNEPGNELKRKKYVCQIEKNIRNLVVILNDFLSLSKLEEGKVMAKNERFDIISFLKSLINETDGNLKSKQTITIISSAAALLVDLDTKLVHHVFINLISNASKYSSDDANIIFKISQKKERVLIQVIDEGIGIPDEEHKHVFERFFRANNAANIEGTGLGLNIVKQYVELMGGTIGFQTQLNIGSTFWVELPIHKE